MASSMAREHAYSIGIEEEYFVFHAETRRAIIRQDKTFIANASRRLGKHLMTEMLQSQIEVATPPCETLGAARKHLTDYRQTLIEEARPRGLGIAAIGTFPLAFWRQQEQTEKERYDAIMQELQMVGMRDMLCGMHVHVEVPDRDRRVALMKDVVPYLPILLALSTSSPFWQGYRTGLHGYRLAAYDELPRTGLPEPFRTEAEYDAYIAALTNAGVIPDASHIWWVVRPSLKHPTIELRIADSCTRVDDAIGIAALFRCLVRAFARQEEQTQLDRIGRAITAENKWRAQRYGVGATFVEPFRRTHIKAAEWLSELLELVADDAAALGCHGEIGRLQRIVADGTSADAQLAVYRAARDAGQTRPQALREVVDWAARETASTPKVK
jgi:glutamate---cysteine ligase / carboxylate-amine ligase